MFYTDQSGTSRTVLIRVDDAFPDWIGTVGHRHIWDNTARLWSLHNTSPLHKSKHLT